jgi:hypothetical protein
VDHVFGLLISSEICPNQYLLGVRHLLYVLFKAELCALLYFFRKFNMYFLKYGNPFKHCICQVSEKLLIKQMKWYIKIRYGAVSCFISSYLRPISIASLFLPSRQAAAAAALVLRLLLYFNRCEKQEGAFPPRRVPRSLKNAFCLLL